MNGNSSFKVQEFYDWVYSYGDPNRTPQAEAARRRGNLDEVIRVPETNRQGMNNTSLPLKSPNLTEAEQHTARYSTMMLKQEDIVRRIRECYFSQMDQESLTELAGELGLLRNHQGKVHLSTPELPLEEAAKRVAERALQEAKSKFQEWLKPLLA